MSIMIVKKKKESKWSEQVSKTFSFLVQNKFYEDYAKIINRVNYTEYKRVRDGECDTKVYRGSTTKNISHFFPTLVEQGLSTIQTNIITPIPQPKTYTPQVNLFESF